MKTPSFWRDDTALSRLLWPLSLLYGFGAGLDRRFTRPQRAPLPVLAIGNITAGGAGKTPTALALARLLQQQGAQPHLISRGYGGRAQAARGVRADDDWRLVGDEAMLLARAAPTWIARRRVDAAILAQQHGASLAIADDALQHYALAADLTLLVIDGAYGIGNGRLHPAGPLRESLASALRRCDAVVLIGDDTHGLRAQIPKPVISARLEVSATMIAPVRSGSWHAFAGLGRPQKFYELLRQQGVTLSRTIDFADHHPYQPRELDQLLAQAQAAGASLVTTEKDFVKIPARYHGQIHCLPVSLNFSEPQMILDLCRQRGLLPP